MRIAIWLTAALSLAPLVALGQSDPMATEATFREAIDGVVWDFKGTFNLKHLRYEGGTLNALDGRGQTKGRGYKHTFIAPGIFKAEFGNDREGWYFVDEGLQWVTPTTCKTAIPFTSVIDVSKPAQPLTASFPDDIKGRDWELAAPEAPYRFRWDGKHVAMVDTRTDKVEEVECVVAMPGVLEGTDIDGHLLWFVFEPNGGQAWMLEMINIYGGAAAGTVSWPDPKKEEETGLVPTEEELASHIETLLKAGKRKLAATLYREMLRRLERRDSEPADTLAKLKTRLGVKQ